MNQLIPIALAAVLLGSAPSTLAEVVAIRDQPGGKRLLVVDDRDLRDAPGGKRLLFVDGSDLRPEPGGERRFFIDGDNVRPAPGGIRLAYFDGSDNTLRRSPGGKILLFIDGKDIRTEPGGKRVLFVDGEVSRAQLVGALALLKPELFKLTPAEEEALKKAMAEAEAESNRLFSEALYGKMSVINSNVKDWGNGAVEVTSGKDRFVYLNLNFKGSPMHAIGVHRKINGHDGIWLAGAPEGKVALAVYEFAGGKLDGQWIPANTAKDGKTVLGIEKLSGSDNIEGTFTITEAKAPNSGAAYTGTLKIEKASPTDAHQVFFGQTAYTLTWTIGGAAIKGIGYTVVTQEEDTKRTFLVAASGFAPTFVVGGLLLESATAVKNLELMRSDLQAGYINVNKE